MARPQTELHDIESIPWQHVEGYLVRLKPIYNF